MNYVNKEELQNILKLSSATIYRMMKDNDLPYIKVRHKLLFDVNHIVEYLSKHEVIKKDDETASN